MAWNPFSFFKYNPVTDGEQTFNIDQALNQNWDKIIARDGEITGAIDDANELIGAKLSKLVGITAGTSTALTASIQGATLDDFTNIQIRLHTDIGDSATLNLNGLGAKPIYTNKGYAISAGSVADSVMNLSYNATSQRWYLLDVWGAVDTSVKNVWQTWARLAGLNPASYADLTAMINNATAMTALANSTDAVNYMIDSTGAIMTAVVASTNAMTKLDLSSYALSKMFANASWYAAMMASSTAVAVLDSTATKVPTMTSNTVPSGTCSGTSKYTGRDYYYAFNNNTSDNSAWASATGTYPSDVGSEYVSYEFAAPVTVYKFVLTNDYDGGVGTMHVPSSVTLMYHDGANWVNAQTYSNASGSNHVAINLVSAPHSARKWAVKVNSVYESNIDICEIGELQFYGKAVA